MASTFFQDYNQNTPVVSAWLNDVNNAVYGSGGTTKTAVQTSAAWVRFSVVGTVVTIQQSSNIASVVRSATGVYVVTYLHPLTNVANCYSIQQNVPGFAGYSAEGLASVTISLENSTGGAADPGSCCVVIYGAN